MSLCANPQCQQPLKDRQWPGGTCSLHCSRKIEAMYEGEAFPAEIEAAQQTQRELGAIEKLQLAAEIDARLPLIILLRSRGHSLRRVARAAGCNEITCRRLLQKCRTQLSLDKPVSI